MIGWVAPVPRTASTSCCIPALWYDPAEVATVHPDFQHGQLIELGSLYRSNTTPGSAAKYVATELQNVGEFAASAIGGTSRPSGASRPDSSRMTAMPCWCSRLT